MVYIIQSKTTSKYYVGFTSNIDRRLLYHNNGSTKSTRLKGPWELIYSEEFLNKADAWKRERQIKSYKGGQAFKKLVSQYGEVA